MERRRDADASAAAAWMVVYILADDVLDGHAVLLVLLEHAESRDRRGILLLLKDAVKKPDVAEQALWAPGRCVAAVVRDCGRRKIRVS